MENITVEDLLALLYLPRRYYGDTFEFLSKFRSEHTYFIEKIKCCNGCDLEDKNNKKIFVQQMKKVKKEADKVFKSLELIVESIESADHSSAQKKFDKLMNQIKQYCIFSTIDGWTIIEGKKYLIRDGIRNNFYRVRRTDYENSNIERDAGQLFHIPYSKRWLASSERFSSVGLPALYLASNLPLAWQETGYPPKYYYSIFQYDRTYELNNGFLDRVNIEYIKNESRFITLCSPDEILNKIGFIESGDFDFKLTILSNYLITYPLILACSFVNDNKSNIYKQEYIISQMLMDWIIRNKEYYGISYFSCIDITDIDVLKWNAYNIAMPTRNDFNSNGQSESLLNSFTWTKPQFYEVPICNNSNTIKDGQELTTILNHLEYFLRHSQVNIFKMEYREYINFIIALRALLSFSNKSDMRLVLATFNSIKMHFYYTDYREDELMNKACEERDREKLSDDSFKIETEQFKKLGKYRSIIGGVIFKYGNKMCDLSPDWHMYTIYHTSQTNNLEEIKEYLKNNNILFCFRNIDNLKGKDLEEFLDIAADLPDDIVVPFMKSKIPSNVEKNTWIINNLSSFNFPLYQKIGSFDGTDGIVAFGTDVDKIKDTVK